MELSAKEEEAHASTYQRYDDHLDDNFTPDDDLYPNDNQEDGQYQGWSAPEERGHHYQLSNQNQGADQSENQDGDRKSVV